MIELIEDSTGDIAYCDHCLAWYNLLELWRAAIEKSPPLYIQPKKSPWWSADRFAAYDALRGNTCSPVWVQTLLRYGSI